MTAQRRPIAQLLRSTSFRLAAASGAGFLIAASVIVAFIFWQTNSILTEHVVGTLRTEAAELGRLAASDADGRALADAVRSRSSPAGPGLYFLGGRDGAKIEGNLNQLPPELRDAPQGGVFSYRPPGEASAARLGVAIPAEAGPGRMLIVGRDIEDLRAYAAQVRRIFIAGFVLLALAALAAAVGVSRSVLSRIEAITVASRSIMAGDLARRVPLQGNDDELDGLAASLNAMLERIEQLLAGLREVSDNIAHDLKTPLNRLRNRAEAALRDARGASACREGLERTIEDADELIKTFNALLLIARLEAGAVEESAEVFELGPLVAGVAELYEPAAEEAGLEVGTEVAPGLVVRANKQLVSQAVANLVDNAIKYASRAVAADSGRHDITVRVTAAGDTAEVAVGDRGPGIAPEDRERALRRFVRLEKSRTRPGTGLGLSLVAAVARLHGGTVRLEDNRPGLRAILALPRYGVRVSDPGRLAMSGA